MNRPFSRRSAGDADGGSTAEFAVVGLGNPGDRYRGTRHNVGFGVVELLASRRADRLRPSRNSSLETLSRINGHAVALACPTTFMNDSGRAVGPLLRRLHLPLEQLIVVHDELDLPEGRIKIKVGGGLAGHNGLRSIVEHTKSPDFIRVRIGIGKPPGGKDRGASHVLSPVRGSSKESLSIAIIEAADAVECIVEDGVDQAMRTWNSPEGRS